MKAWVTITDNSSETCSISSTRYMEPLLSRSLRKCDTYFVEHGEYGVALETLSGIIGEEGKRISFEAYEQIHGLGERMEMEPEVWERLRGSIIDSEHDTR